MPERIVDLRSDTVTLPTPEMYAAIAKAELGDDVLGHDPTVRGLEELAAEMSGMEDAIFVPSGTMGNQIALATHTKPGESALFEEEAHMLYYEGGSPAVIAGVLTISVPGKHGVPDPADIERRILKRSEHTPGTTLLCLESTHNRAGGTVIPLETHRACREMADRNGLKIHLDGARVFNAAVALGVELREITAYVDTVNFCLSKGLASPVGSVLVGPAEFIREARYWRKRLGGGMRQAGILAACGIVSLKTMVERLAEDHARTARLGEALAELPGLNPWPAPTNILIVETERPAGEWVQALEARGVHCIAFAPHRLRLVLHKDVDDAGLSHAIAASAEAARAW